MAFGPSPKAGLYIHFPFCRRKCPYCHFQSVPVDAHLLRSWISIWRKGIVGEAELFSAGVAGPIPPDLEFDTLYIGGGTPSLMTGEELSGLREDLAARLPLRPAEFTLEANPFAGAGLETFRSWIRAGVTRLSVGAQSFDDGVLRTLGREATAEQTETFLLGAREAGFGSLGLDLMVGIPGETPDSLERTLGAVRRIAPDHVSLYFLENVEGLPFEKVLRDQPVEEDEAVDAFERAADFLASMGRSRYEISNFARPGRECLHNVKYWRYEPFAGFGPSAASHFGGKRWTNTGQFDAWRKGAVEGLIPASESLRLGPETAAREALASGLRLVDGIDLDVFTDRFGIDPMFRLRKEIDDLDSDGLIERKGRILRIPPEMLLVSNAIIARLVGGLS
jgi:oxygen-independent coproporphyrinogen-3 oxidase